MHRQSLGSPGSKLSSSTNDEITLETPIRISSTLSLITDHEDEEKVKLVKLHKSPSNPEKLIHLIPIFTFLCFLILYLCSHDPSQSDLAHFDGFMHVEKSLVDVAEESNIGRYLEVKSGDVLAIRSLKNAHRKKSQQLHRKIGEF